MCDGKGKSNIRFGVGLRQIENENLSMMIDFKIKKKSELRQFIESELKKQQKQEYHISKLCKISFS